MAESRPLAYHLARNEKERTQLWRVPLLYISRINSPTEKRAVFHFVMLLINRPV